jgi:SAM-dependent methyltransferase
MTIHPMPVCSICRSSRVESFFRLPEVPVYCNVLWDTPREAKLCPRGDIELTLCRSCGMIANAAFDPMLVAYEPRYENSLHFSPLFQDYAERLAQRLVHTYELQGKTIIEIGCGKGEFLALLCRLGDNLGIGFDPSYIKGRVDTGAGRGLSIIPDHFSDKYADLACDILVCRQTLEHIPDPLAFLNGIRHALGHRQIPVFFEVPNALFTLRHGGIWDVIYEHCSYFCPSSLAHLFRQSHLSVRGVRQDFGGQFLCLDAANTNGAPSGPAVQEDTEDVAAQLRQDARKLGQEFRESVEYWRKALQKLQQSGKRAVVWGGGSKGVTFLNAVRGEGIEYVVDLNSHKHGRYVPGTGQRVVPPAFLQEYHPDTVLVMNPIYRDEIQGQLRSLGLKAEVMTV